MLTTRFAGGLRARPLDARPDRKAGVIFFVIDVRGLKDDEVKTSPEVCFTVIDADAKAYLSITGHADIVAMPRSPRGFGKRIKFGGPMGRKT
jgi:general stress protein 26